MSVVLTSEQKELLTQMTLPPRSETLAALRQEMEAREPNIEIMAELIAKDIGLAGQVLSVVNSSAYSPVQKVDSIKQAVMMLGIEKLMPLIRAASLKSSLISHGFLADYWRYNEWTAQACLVVARLLKREKLANYAYQFGLFQGAGVPLLYLNFEGYERFIKQSNQVGWREIAAKEEASLLVSHATASAALAQYWRLPATLVKMIYFYYNEDVVEKVGESTSAIAELIGIHRLARYCIDQQTRSIAGNKDWQAFKAPTMATFNLADNDVNELLDNTVDHVF
ncbi:HD-like signal output (HDOD) protein [Idiomarina fontislapidosi]|uniref:HDOD domain-containing protein n=1 Tax=Idiomarina fontislapidosi TaxID=263723 RepID=A0A432XWV1_9GAMM|nr:HDOD domain-containing protein [Idiomarina fontislapidosi]PYE31997.1 HD-like signal output (HDOD) protein [Idiomarina fontislapidosi]RUO53206.1 hypothetical protein CWE25_08225 [Idiomarina fontislapidosi]|tara:strand:- start:137 stop:979 length:843 start_codon:yes stop_codon:yes gene_type:complete